MNNIELENVLNDLLKPTLIKDYCPNGLQIEGRDNINKIITGVSACQALIDRAIEEKADAILVHHGYFWRGEAPSIRGMKYKRIKALIENGINLYAYHLPLDVHPELGNNAQLGALLGVKNLQSLEGADHPGLVMCGEFTQSLTPNALGALLENQLLRKPLHIECTDKKQISTVAWCTGGGQDFIDLAAKQGIDAFISGEISERTTFSAREQGIHYFAAGHHATERYGIKALGEWLASYHNLDTLFIDVDNPV